MKLGLVDAVTIAKICGVGRQRICNLASDGVLLRADRGRFDIPSTVQAFFKHKFEKAMASDDSTKSLTSERSRLVKLKADKAERETKVEAGELVPAADVEAAWLAVVDTARTRMRLIPKKIAPRAATGTAIEAERLMQKEIDAALSELATTPVI